MKRKSEDKQATENFVYVQYATSEKWLATSVGRCYSRLTSVSNFAIKFPDRKSAPEWIFRRSIGSPSRGASNPSPLDSPQPRQLRPQPAATGTAFTQVFVTKTTEASDHVSVSCPASPLPPAGPRRPIDSGWRTRPLGEWNQLRLQSGKKIWHLHKLGQLSNAKWVTSTVARTVAWHWSTARVRLLHDMIGSAWYFKLRSRLSTLCNQGDLGVGPINKTLPSEPWVSILH